MYKYFLSLRFFRSRFLTLAAFLATILHEGINVPFSTGTFRLTMTGPIVLLGLGSGIILGAIGALPPAIRCLKAPLPVALRSQ